MRVKCSNILMWMLIVSPIVDNFNGFLLLQGLSSSLSTMYKALILVFCIYIISKSRFYRKDFNNIMIIVILCIQILIFELDKTGFLSFNISYLIKLVMPIVLVTAFHSLKASGVNIDIIIKKIFAFYCWFFPLSLIIPSVLGVGYTTYRTGVGSKGFYYAGNEISSVMMIILAIGLIRYLEEKKKINLVNLIVIICACASISTKTSYLVIIFELAIVFLLSKEISFKMKGIVMTILGGTISAFVILKRENIIVLIDQWKWVYANRYSDMLSFLLSGRNYRLVENIDKIYDEKGFLKIFFGANPGWVIEELNALIEMDFIDLFVGFGVIGTLCIVMFYFRFIFLVILKKNIFGVAILLLIFSNSFFAGHILTAPMVNSVLVLFCLYLEVTGNGFTKNKRIEIL